MNYSYAYKTSDGTRHEAAMEAESRDAVFAALRAKGIRPIKVVAADGSKANGEMVVRGVRKRVVIVATLLAALIAGTLVFILAPRSRTGNSGPASFIVSETRRQVIGDAGVIEKGIRTGWAGVFEHEGERFLASFAIPGVKVGQRNTTVGELTAALERHVAAKGSEALEVRQIKAMVEGMKREARRYVAAGGDLETYGKRLIERQQAEAAVYERTRSELEQAKKELKPGEFLSLLDTRNDQLRNLGIRLVTFE